MSGVEVVEKGKEPHDFSVRITYTREAPDEVEAEEEGVSEETCLQQADGKEKVDEVELVDLAQPVDPETPELSLEDEQDQVALIPNKVEGDSGGAKQLPPERKHTSSIVGASFNFINSIIGSGIIGIPSALQQAGFLSGMVLLFLVAVITDYTVVLLIKDGIITGKLSYQEMVTAAFGRPGYWFLTFAQFLFPFFAMAGYVVITGDTFSRIVENLAIPPILKNEWLIKLVMVVAVMLPLSMLRNIARLEKFSAVAIALITFIVGMTVYFAADLYCSVRCFQPDCCDSPFTTWVVNKGIIQPPTYSTGEEGLGTRLSSGQSVGIMGAAFVCHHNTYLIYASLRKRSLTRFTYVSHISVLTSFVFCLVLGLAGFVTFMDQTQGDLLNNYCVTGVSAGAILANITRFVFAAIVMLTYPIECFVAREVLEIALSKAPFKLIAWIPVYWIRKALDSLLYTPRHKSLPRHILLTLLLVASTLVIGMTTNDFGVVLAFNGCFTAIPLAFIIPTASYLKLSKQGRWYSRDKVIAFLVLVFGVIVMFIGTGLAIVQAVDSYSRSERYNATDHYCPGDPMNNTCCRLYNSTVNFTITVPLCDCTGFCADSSLLELDTCNNSTTY